MQLKIWISPNTNSPRLPLFKKSKRFFKIKLRSLSRHNLQKDKKRPMKVYKRWSRMNKSSKFCKTLMKMTHTNLIDFCVYFKNHYHHLNPRFHLQTLLPRRCHRHLPIHCHLPPDDGWPVSSDCLGVLRLLSWSGL